jgi:hypothetical protein
MYQHTLTKSGKSRELVKIDRALGEMVSSWMVLGEVIALVGEARCPVDQELFL